MTLGISADTLAFWPNDLSLQKVFGWLFSPVAFLMGVARRRHPESRHAARLEAGDQRALRLLADEGIGRRLPDFMTPIGRTSSTAFALTGFANFSSVGIQLGGIGAMAPDRRHDLARLGMRALFVGFTATLLNAAIAGVVLSP